jgi:hypothetical protein
MQYLQLQSALSSVYPGNDNIHWWWHATALYTMRPVPVISVADTDILQHNQSSGSGIE